MNGILELDGEAIDVVDAAVIRDRSWGPRPVVVPQEKNRGAYLFAMAADDHAFQAFAINPTPWQEDPIYGTTENVVSGFYVKDGVEGRLVSGTRQVLERGDDGRPQRELLLATDEHGRELHARGEMVTPLRWTCWGDIFNFWAYMQWSIDGADPAPGEVQDWFMSRHWSSVMRQRATAEIVAAHA
jgi:hypothetical protein